MRPERLEADLFQTGGPSISRVKSRDYQTDTRPRFDVNQGVLELELRILSFDRWTNLSQNQ